MSKAYKCDACGKLYEPTSTCALPKYTIKTQNESHRIKHVITLIYFTKNYEEIPLNFDLCPECFERVMKIVSGGKENE